MSSAALLNELRLAQELVTALLEPIQDDSYRRQYHHDLSPLGWHLGHCTYTECYWLQEVVLNDNRFTAPVADIYTAGVTPKPQRGNRLPALDVLIQWTLGMQSLNAETLETSPPTLTDHPLMQDDYLLHFLVQHYSQHYENMLAILAQRALTGTTADFETSHPVTSSPLRQDRISIQAGHYRVGGIAPTACDNELPAQQATLGPCEIARNPVSNSEFLAFMEDGGYQEQQFWSDDGWHWLQQENISGPQHWHRNSAGNWYGIGLRGAYDLHADDVVTGISRHEAQAYANRAGGRLPHEYQWEVACRHHPLEDTGHAWEWCENQFYPYEGFTPFPYKEYSQEWFDGKHYSLRGGSLHTRPAIKRASFRNFYQPDKRHMFAGLRLVY